MDFDGASDSVDISGSSGVVDTFGDIILDRNGIYRPALGPAWYHCVTTRIIMNTAINQYIHGGNSSCVVSGEGESEVRRVLNLVKSPVAGNISMDYVIRAGGLVVATEEGTTTE